MTDYLEEGPGQGEALLQALEELVLWVPTPDGRAAEADGDSPLPAPELFIPGSSASPAERREPDREGALEVPTGMEAFSGGGREEVDGGGDLPLLSALLEQERAWAALNEIRAAPEASGIRRSGGRLEAGPALFHRPVPRGGGIGMGPDRQMPPPGWAAEGESASGPSVRQVDQAFRRDSRRYDGGFFLY